MDQDEQMAIGDETPGTVCAEYGLVQATWISLSA
jgi:hypothetical protein